MHIWFTGMQNSYTFLSFFLGGVMQHHHHTYRHTLPSPCPVSACCDVTDQTGLVLSLLLVERIHVHVHILVQFVMRLLVTVTQLVRADRVCLERNRTTNRCLVSGFRVIAFSTFQHRLLCFCGHSSMPL